MNFIRLTARESGRTIYLQTDQIISIEPELEGCYIQAGGKVFIVSEKHKVVMERIHASNQGDSNE